MKTTYHTKKINGVEIFYRESGDAAKPTLVLLHGYPTSSLESHGTEIAALIGDFLARKVVK